MGFEILCELGVESFCYDIMGLKMCVNWVSKLWLWHYGIENVCELGYHNFGYGIMGLKMCVNWVLKALAMAF